jgi:hypothetical protein
MSTTGKQGSVVKASATWRGGRTAESFARPLQECERPWSRKPPPKQTWYKTPPGEPLEIWGLYYPESIGLRRVAWGPQPIAEKGQWPKPLQPLCLKGHDLKGRHGEG